MVMGICLSPHIVLNTISVPSDFPIQLRCISLRESVQSMVSRPLRSLSA